MAARKASFTGFNRRGRPTSDLRIWARDNVAKLKPLAKSPKFKSIEVDLGEGGTVEIPVPTGAVILPVAMTSGRSAENVRELVKLGVVTDSGGTTPNVASGNVEGADGEKYTVYLAGYGRLFE